MTTVSGRSFQLLLDTARAAGVDPDEDLFALFGEREGFLSHVTLPPMRPPQTLVPGLSPTAAEHASRSLRTMTDEGGELRRTTHALCASARALGAALATAHTAEAAGRVVADTLAISLDTAAEHVARVLRKAGAKRRADLVALWRAEPQEGAA